MKILKSIVSIMLCIVMCSILPTVFATTPPKITISNVSALPGQEVTIDLSIQNNPGIMAMAFSVTYDNSNLEYVNFSKGYITSPQAHKDHTDKGYVVFVVTESTDKNNDTIMSITFKIKDDASAGKYPIRLANHYYETKGYNISNCFSNSKEDYIVPTVIDGSITVRETCENSGHKYGDWTIVTAANCTNTGIKTHACQRCNFSEESIIPVTHDFETEWTVDKAATPTEDGKMSRHCKLCNATTDEVTFSYEEIGGDDDSTSEDSTSSDVSNNQSSSDITSDNDTSDDKNDDDNTASNTTSSNNSNQSNTSSSSQTSSSNTTSSTTTDKPNINNTVGSKIPLSEVEKLEDYKENIKPNIDNSSNENPIDEKDDENSTLESDSTITTGDITDNSNDKSDDNSSSKTLSTTNIIIYIVCGILSVGIVALAIILIIKRKK